MLPFSIGCGNDHGKGGVVFLILLDESGLLPVDNDFRHAQRRNQPESGTTRSPPANARSRSFVLPLNWSLRAIDVSMM